MNEKLFIGVADNNHFATAVVGDSQGRIVATSVGDSVNAYFLGLGQARENLKKLVSQAVDWRERHLLAGMCLTCKSGFIDNDLEMSGLVYGLFQDIEVSVEKFTTSCTLGIGREMNRMILIGGGAGIALCEDINGLRFCLRHNTLIKDLKAKIVQKGQAKHDAWGAAEICSIFEQCSALHRPDQVRLICRGLDLEANRGNPIALEIAYDIAADLVDLVITMAAQLKMAASVIGLYGSVLLGSAVIFERVCHLINLIFPDVLLKKAIFTPAKGAYLSTLLTKGFELEEELMSNLSETSNGLEQKLWPDSGN